MMIMDWDFYRLLENFLLFLVKLHHYLKQMLPLQIVSVNGGSLLCPALLYMLIVGLIHIAHILD